MDIDEKMLEWMGEIHQFMGEIRADTSTLKTIARENRDRIHSLEKGVASHTTCIDTLTSIVTNGLSSKVDMLVKCADRRRIERSTGIVGFFRDSWNTFTHKFGWFVFALLAWSVWWIVLKSGVFHERPFWLK